MKQEGNGPTLCAYVKSTIPEARNSLPAVNGRGSVQYFRLGHPCISYHSGSPIRGGPEHQGMATESIAKHHTHFLHILSKFLNFSMKKKLISLV